MHRIARPSWWYGAVDVCFVSVPLAAWWITSCSCPAARCVGARPRGLSLVVSQVFSLSPLGLHPKRPLRTCPTVLVGGGGVPPLCHILNGEPKSRLGC